MKHRLFNLAAATSLLLCLACLFMWVRSYRVYDYLYRMQVDGHETTIQSNIGYIGCQWLPSNEVPTARSKPWRWTVYHEPVFGLEVGTSYLYLRRKMIVVVLPYWLLTSVSGILPALWFWQWRREKKAARGRGFEVLPAPAAKTGP